MVATPADDPQPSIGARAGYGVVLVVIGLTYVLSVVAESSAWTAAVVLFLQLVALRVVLMVVGARRALLRVTDVVILVIVLSVVAAAVFGKLTDQAAVTDTLYWISAILYGLAPVVIVVQTLGRPTIDVQTLLATVAAYLMIGMFFAFLYRATAATQSAPFFGSAGDGTVSDDLFFSFVTLTTTGYGNIVPAGNPGQTFAVTEAIVGQLFLVTAVAKVVNQSGVLLGRRARRD